jgi:hypothetical protein
MKSQKIKNIIEILNKVAEGSISGEDGLIQWQDIDLEDDSLITASWHDLSHFANDGDIRKKDKEYAGYQRDLLKTRAKEISEKYGHGAE